MSTIRNLPLINGSQNGYAGYNTMVRELSALTLGHIIGFATNPPGSPQVHDMYVVNTSATGAWSGFTANSIAYYTSDNTWLNFLPNYGLCLFFDSDDSIKYYNGTSWVSVSSSGSLPVGNGGAFLTYNAVGTLTAANTSDELNFSSTTATAITIPALVGASRNLVVTIASTQSAIDINLPTTTTSVSYSTELVLKFTGSGSAVVTLKDSLGNPLRTFNKLASDVFSVKVHKPAGSTTLETEVRRISSSGGASDLSDMGKWSTSAAFVDGDIMVYDAPTNTWTPEQYSINTLRNVSISSPSTNQVLAYNGTNWVNQSGGSVPATGTAGTFVAYDSTGALTAVDSADINDFPNIVSTNINIPTLLGDSPTRVITIGSTQASLTVTLPTIATALSLRTELILKFTGTISGTSTVSLFYGATLLRTFERRTNDIFSVKLSKPAGNAQIEYEVKRIASTNGATDLSDLGFWQLSGGIPNNSIMRYFTSTKTWAPTSYILDSLLNVSITSPATNQVLTYNGTSWVNQNIAMPSFNITSPTNGQALRYNGTNWVNQDLPLPNVSITSPTSGQALRYNGTNWVNQNLPLPNVSITSPTSGQALRYDGTNWVNQNLPLPNVVITSPTNGQVLTYNGTNWVNQAPSGGGGGSQPTSGLISLTGTYFYDPIASTNYTEHFEFSGTATTDALIDITNVPLATGFTKVFKIFRSSSRIIAITVNSPNVVVGTDTVAAGTAPIEVSLSKPPGSQRIYCSMRLL